LTTSNTAFHKNVPAGIKLLKPTTFKSTGGAKNDKNIIYGAAFFGSGSLSGGTLVGGKGIVVRLTAVSAIK
jgi:hypothetical protein